MGAKIVNAAAVAAYKEKYKRIRITLTKVEKRLVRKVAKIMLPVIKADLSDSFDKHKRTGRLKKSIRLSDSRPGYLIVKAGNKKVTYAPYVVWKYKMFPAKRPANWDKGFSDAVKSVVMGFGT